MPRRSRRRSAEVVEEQSLIDPYADEEHKSRWSDSMQPKERQAYHTLVRLRKQHVHEHIHTHTPHITILTNLSDIESEDDLDHKHIHENIHDEYLFPSDSHTDTNNPIHV